MNWLLEHWIAIAMFAVYTAVICHHALLGKRRTKTVADYYVGGRSMGGVVLGLSFFATYSSTNSFVGLAGQGHAFGAPWLLLAPCAVLFSLLAWWLVAPRLRRFTEQLDSVTIPDYIGFRFSSRPARTAAAAIVVSASLLYMTAVYKGIGNLLETFLGLPYTGAIAVVFVVVVAYTAVGGFISVVWTDAAQALVMLVAGVVLFAGTVGAAGGPGQVLSMVTAADTGHLFAWDAAMAFPVLIGILVAGTMKMMVEPRQLSRFYALADDRAARRGMVVSTLAFLLLYSMLAPIGLLAWRVLESPVRDTDRIVPALLGDPAVFPEVAGAFLMIAMLAAAMSSLDSVLLVTATTVERDLLGRFRRGAGERETLRSTRWLVAVLAAVTGIVALDPPGQIVTLTTFSGSLFAACFFPAVVLGLHWRRGDGAAVLGSFAVGIATLLLWPHLRIGDVVLGEVVHRVFPAVALSTLCYAALAVLRPGSSDTRVLHCFAQH